MFVVDADKLNVYRDDINRIVKDLGKTIFLIVGKYKDIPDVKEMPANLKTIFTEHNEPLHILKLVEQLKEDIRDFLGERAISLETRLLGRKSTNVYTTTDTASHTLKESREHAEAILKQMYKDCKDKHEWETRVTQFSHTISPKKMRLVTAMAKSFSHADTEINRNDLDKLIKQQLRKIPKSIRLFLRILDKHKDKAALILKHLQILINKESEITTIGVEDMLREVSCIYDSILELRLVSDFDLPEGSTVASIFADLIISGSTFELIDGKTGFLPTTWIKYVFRALSVALNNPKVAVISVLGVQSSGKSTMLNCMFGVDMRTGSGKCTKGVKVRLLPVADKSLKFSELLIADSEGLRAPDIEFDKDNKHHDNQLATFVTGICNVLLINNMGESFYELRDILEMVIHALLRLKIAESSLTLGQTCMFLHQNVSDEFALTNMMGGFVSLLTILDSVTLECAKSLGHNNITKFNDIIKLEIKSDIFTIPSLWQGYPPMKTVSTNYSKKLLQIKEKILESVRVNATPVLHIDDIAVQLTDLWKAVLSEEFVFSFRNNLELRAFNDLDEQIENLKWQLEVFSKETTKNTLNENFCNCTNNDSLDKAEKLSHKQLETNFMKEKELCLQKLDAIFDKSKYKEIVFRWKAQQTIAFRQRTDWLLQSSETKLRKHKICLLLKINTSNISEQDRLKVQEKALQTARCLHKNTITESDINKTFEDDVWAAHENEMLQKYKHDGTMDFMAVFNRELDQKFLKETQILKKLRSEHKCFCLSSEIKSLSDIETQVRLLIKKSNSKIKDLLKKDNATVEYFVPNFLNKIEDTIKPCLDDDHEIEDTDVSLFLNSIDDLFKSSFGDWLSGESKVMCYLNVCKYACPLFIQNNNRYLQKHGIERQLQLFKPVLKAQYDAALNGYEREKSIANCISVGIVNFCRDAVKSVLPLECTKILKLLMPLSKSKLITKICEDLVKQDNFSLYIKYIEDPKKYATEWLVQLAKNVLLENSILEDTIQRLWKNVENTMFTGIKQTSEAVRKQCFTITAGVWLKALNENIQEYSIQRTYFMFSNTEEQIQNFEFFNECLNKSFLELITSCKADVSEPKSIQALKEDTIVWFEAYLVPFLWGCNEVCWFCNEPCAKSIAPGHKHMCKQHRPGCCRGIREKGCHTAKMTVCNFDVKTSDTYNCKVIKFKCKCKTLQSHSYKSYRKILTDWDIEPFNDRHRTSMFWMRFVAKHERSLSEQYSCKIDVPKEWKQITENEALENLDAFT